MAGELGLLGATALGGIIGFGSTILRDFLRDGARHRRLEAMITAHAATVEEEVRQLMGGSASARIDADLWRAVKVEYARRAEPHDVREFNRFFGIAEEAWTEWLRADPMMRDDPVEPNLKAVLQGVRDAHGTLLRNRKNPPERSW